MESRNPKEKKTDFNPDRNDSNPNPKEQIRVWRKDQNGRSKSDRDSEQLRTLNLTDRRSGRDLPAGTTAVVRRRNRHCASTEKRVASSGQQGTIARLLDGGVLSHGRARAPARNFTAAPSPSSSSGPPWADTTAARPWAVQAHEEGGEGRKRKRGRGEQPWNSYGGRRPPRSPPPLPFSALREKASREMV